MDLLPPEIQDQMALELEMGVGNAEQGGGGDVPRPEVETDKATKKGKAIPAFSPIFTDGRFLFGVEAKKFEDVPGLEKATSKITDEPASQPGDESVRIVEEKIDSTEQTRTENDKESGKDKVNGEEEKVTKVYLTVHAFDPEEKLEHCHSVTLKRPPPKNDECVLDFNPPGY
ncbi:hypothetical protein RFI_35266 [Reticulomyxa filosa]|uniref:Uncharacterized protein n=1 Tax=Reticulomyxa filosa TaxID=46433 RepID=X6LN68_RETFI|nr:hypothetical protein RFI_35266 [Reticulomyxa filosa]|eukprot:ETO02170.1 hypothetical protein RFI_35266 [Reticulomyxa filosa]